VAAVAALITLISAPVSNKKFNGRTDWGVWTWTHKKPSEYSKGTTVVVAGAAPRHAAKHNQMAL
jgi:hypothetical protein